MGLGSGLRVVMGRGGLRDEIGPGEWPSNRDRPGWPWKLESIGKTVFRNPGDARQGFEVIAERGSLGRLGSC